MKKLLRVACCVLGLALSAQASTVSFSITNSDTTAYEGPLMVYPIRLGREGMPPILADGSFFIAGVPTRVEMTNGLGTASLMRGPYFASNSVVAFCFPVPTDTGSYNAAELKVGGYNLFEYVPGVTADTVSNLVAALVGEGGGGGTNAGPAGEAATITIGEVTTLPAGSLATVENVGTSNAAVLVFGLPAGPAKAAPTIRSIAAEYTSVTLAWDASVGTNAITNYIVYWGVSSRTYTNQVAASTNLSVTVSNLATGAMYYFAATAVDSNGLESAYSDEVSALLLPGGGGAQVWTNDYNDGVLAHLAGDAYSGDLAINFGSPWPLAIQTNGSAMAILIQSDDGTGTNLTSFELQASPHGDFIIVSTLQDGRVFRVMADGSVLTSALTIIGTDNQINFGGTNSAPLDAVNPVWVSVSVAGDTNAWRVPLYK
jgi:hypothetical protein